LAKHVPVRDLKHRYLHIFNVHVNLFDLTFRTAWINHQIPGKRL
jgi:hypothetical protein